MEKKSAERIARPQSTMQTAFIAVRQIQQYQTDYTDREQDHFGTHGRISLKQYDIPSNDLIVESLLVKLSIHTFATHSEQEVAG